MIPHLHSDSPERGLGERLQTLFVNLAAHRRALSDPSRERLKNFFEAARPLLRADRSKPKVSHRVRIDLERAASALKAIVGPLRRAGEAGASANVWAIAGLRRNEVRNAAALAGLWSPNLYPLTAAPFLAEFLNQLPNSDTYPSFAELASGYTVQTEDCPLGDLGNRIDISIESRNYLVLMEVKIDAPEGERQVSRYDDLARAKARLLGKTPVLILLGPRPAKTGLAKHATWANVSTAARSVSTQRRATDMTFAHHLLRQFAAHVANFHRGHRCPTPT